MKFKIFLIAFISLFFFSACSPEDCSLKDSTYLKYDWDSNSKSCVVIKEIPRNVCGNGVLEEGETYCNCPKDVQKIHPQFGCDGKLGNYLSKQCSDDKECVLMQNEKIVEQTRILEFRNSDITIEGKITLNTPFILNSYDDNKVLVELNLFRTSTNSNIKNLVVRDIKIENTNSFLYGSADYNLHIDMTSSTLPSKEISLLDTTSYESNENLRLRLVVSYVREILDTKGEIIRTEEKIETLTASLGRWNIINPNLFK